MSISIYQLKSRFQQLLRPALDVLQRAGFTPNQVTLGAMALSIAYGAALALNPTSAAWWLGLPTVLLLRMALNALDGMLAKAGSLQSPLGALLNEMCDQVSDIALYAPFALIAGIQPPLVCAALLLALLAEFAGVLATSIGAPRGFAGPMGKSDRAFSFGVLALLYGFGAAAAWMNGLLAVVALLSAVTIFNRLRCALRLSAPTTR